MPTPDNDDLFHPPEREESGGVCTDGRVLVQARLGNHSSHHDPEQTQANLLGFLAEVKAGDEAYARTHKWPASTAGHASGTRQDPASGHHGGPKPTSVCSWKAKTGASSTRRS